MFQLKVEETVPWNPRVAQLHTTSSTNRRTSEGSTSRLSSCKWLWSGICLQELKDCEFLTRNAYFACNQWTGILIMNTSMLGKHVPTNSFWRSLFVVFDEIKRWMCERAKPVTSQIDTRLSILWLEQYNLVNNKPASTNRLKYLECQIFHFRGLQGEMFQLTLDFGVEEENHSRNHTHGDVSFDLHQWKDLPPHP